MIAHWAGVYFEHIKLDGQGVPALASSPNAAVSPPLLSGHGLQAASQVVLGPATLAHLHKHVGDTVVADTGLRSPVRLRIVGTAAFPTIGSSGSPSLQMGTGAVTATVAWQSSVPAVVGVIFGVPLSTGFGRWLWTLFAEGLSVVPDPVVPGLYMVVVALGAIVFANLVAVYPGRVAARTPTALLLRTE